MDEPLKTDMPTTSEKPEDNARPVERTKNIENPTITRLLHAARRIVEEKVWRDGMVWYPAETYRRLFPSELAKQVFPDIGTPAAGACARSIRRYTGTPLTEEGARDWLTGVIERRLHRYVTSARSKTREIRLVVTERKITVRAERPDTTRKAVGPGPWTTQI
jgi:hypothetical protein